MTRRFFSLAILTCLVSLKVSSQAAFREIRDRLPAVRTVSILPQNFYNQHKGFVCKKEDLLQNATGLNLFIRLGSKNFVDYLEKKPNAPKP